MKEVKLTEIKNHTSQTLCLAKFHEATIWLYNSRMSGCHHTPTVIVGNTVDTFFNPEEKRMQQDEMLNGNKPSACNYCWNLEKQNLKSDREFKSLAFKTHLSAAEYLDRSYNFKPKALELAFKNTCNLACSYCSPVYSTEWINDIKKYGIYNDLKTDAKFHYVRGIDPDMPVDMDLFWSWFNTVINELESIRVTGGEPLLHLETFEMLYLMTERNPNIECVIATNLCQKDIVIDRFIKGIHKLNNVRINISNESAGEVAEFIRDGMIYIEWLNNVKKLTENTTAKLSISTTITALSLISLDQLFLDIINLRKNISNKPYISINIATYPEFQSIQCLSYYERVFYYEKYTKFFEKYNSEFLNTELNVFDRLIKLLDPLLLNSKQTEYRKDCETFFEQYTRRRNKNKNFMELLGKI